MKLKYYILFLGIMILTACSKDLAVSTPDFDVKTSATTFKVDEPVKFSFEGKADFVSFYSGEAGNDYQFKDGREVNIENVPVFVSFNSSVQAGSQANQLSVLASTDFDGDYSNLEKVKEATWTDITSQFALGTTATFLASGNKDISNLVVPGKPVYIAFKYLTRAQAVNGLVRTWMIQSFNVKSGAQFNGQDVNITDQVLAGFRIVDEDAVDAPSRSLVTSTRVTLQGNIYKDPADPKYDPTNPIYDPANPIYDSNSPSYDPNAVRPKFVAYDPASPFNDPIRENWAISTPINMTKVNLRNDAAVIIKGIRSGLLKEYAYTFTEPGVYQVHFVAKNANADGMKEVNKSITITITE